MKLAAKIALAGLPALLLMSCWCPSGSAQIPEAAPIVADTAAPIVVNAIKPKKKQPAEPKFEGFVMSANTAQITVRAKTSGDMTIRTFSLSPKASAKMQQTVDKGGYQYGDKVTVFYDSNSQMALKVKGKRSRPI